MSRVASHLFMLMQARYGDRFLNQFTSGQQDAAGHDTGVQLALSEWSRHLLRYTEQEVVAAAEASLTTHKRFPPTLPEFRDLCEAEAKRRPPVPWIRQEPSAVIPPNFTEAFARFRRKAAANQFERELAAAKRNGEG